MAPHAACVGLLRSSALALGLLAGGGPAIASEWPERLEGHGGPVRGIALSGDGEALSASFDYSIIHWRLADGRAEIMHRLIGHDAAVNDVAFVPDRRLAVSGSDDGTVGIWDLEAGELVTRFPGTGDKVLEVDVNAAGNLAASAGWDGTARLWQLDPPAPKTVLEGHDGTVNTVSFSEDGRHLFTGGYDGTIRMWDVASGRMARLVHRHGWGINVVRALPGGDYVLFGAVDGAAQVVATATGEVVRELGHHRGPVLAADIDAQAGIAVVAGADGHMRVYRLDDWTMQHDHSNPYGPIWATAFTPDASMIYHGGLDDFVIGLQIDPKLAFEPAAGVFPRRFQMREDMGPGERQFARKCSVCHTLTPEDGNRAGPTLYRLFGRKAGTLPGYKYSDALLNSDIIWNEETIGQLFDHGPDVVTPGTKMPIQRLKNREERDALIAFLKRATGGPAHGEETETR